MTASAPRRSLRRPPLASLLAPSLAILTGVVWAFGFADRPASLLPWVALAPLMLLLGTARPALSGYLFGVAWWAVSMPWLVSTVETFGGLSAGLSWGLFVLLCGYLAIDQGLFGWLGAKLWRSGGWPRWLGLPALWTALETKRAAVLFGGFPWNLASYAVTETPGALPASAWIGAWGVSFAVVAVNVALASAVAEGFRARVKSTQPADRWHAAMPLAVSVAAVALVFGWAHVATEPLTSDTTERVVGLQPNHVLYGESEVLLRQYEALLADSIAVCRGEPTLLIWPESATWPLSWDSPRLRQDVARLERLGCTMLLNSPRRSANGTLNAALLVGEGSADSGVVRTGTQPKLQEYAKRKLVPWGEYVPFGDLLPFVDTLARAVGDFTPGTEVGLLRWRTRTLGTAICYEVIFPAPVAEQVRDGADLLVTVVNDAWYGDTWAPRQHLRAARFRAAETGRPMVRVALTGISAVIDGRGRTIQELGVGERGRLEANLAGGTGSTPFARTPWLPVALAWLGAAFAMIRSRRADGASA